jgi:hypothetical protein
LRLGRRGLHGVHCAHDVRRRELHVIRALALATALALVALSSTARAHPLVDEGRRELRRAQFDAALALFDRAEQRDDMTREDAIDLYDARALAHLALDDAPALRRDLSALAALDPEHRFGREAPPELQEAFSQTVRASEGPLALEGRTRGLPGAIEVEVTAMSDPGIVQEVRVFVRVGGGSWRRLTGQSQSAGEGQTLDYYAEAVGPGGAVLATLGTREEPRPSEPALAPGSPQPIRAGGGGGGGGGGGPSPWLFVGIGAAVAAVAALVVVIVVLVTGSQPAGTQPEPPLVIGF